MRRRWISLVGGFVLLLLGAPVGGQSDDSADGKALYLENCGGCHGLISSKSSAPRPVRAALASPAGLIPANRPSASRGHSGRVSLDPGFWMKGGTRVAVAPPYGPTLRGVYGRPAGTVEGFLYSREFLKRLQGVIWTRETLDIWIADSQAWVPGSMMFYKQPDPEARRKIIAYLSNAK